MLITLKRHQCGDGFTLGTMHIDGLFLGYTCEDEDRKLEEVGTDAKIKGKTAIPRGRYEVVLSFSNRFQKIMPEVLSVPGFSGIRIHGGNSAADTLGCPLLGAEQTETGVRDCAAVNSTLKRRIQLALDRNERVWLEVS